MADDVVAYLTIAELSIRLGVSESTVRNWRRAYGDLIPSVLGADGIRRYALSRFEQVAVLRRRELPAAEIRSALAEQPEATAETDDFQAAVISRLDRLIALLEQIAERSAPPEP